jgi:uncharacterized protein (DUF4415 family)
MTAKRPASRRTLGSDLKKVDAHRIKRSEYRELPELTDEMLERAVINKGGRPRSPNPRRLISLRLPADVIERWRASGPGWQTRMAERLARGPIPRAKN